MSSRKNSTYHSTKYPQHLRTPQGFVNSLSIWVILNWVMFGQISIIAEWNRVSFKSLGVGGGCVKYHFNNGKTQLNQGSQQIPEIVFSWILKENDLILDYLAYISFSGRGRGSLVLFFLKCTLLSPLGFICGRKKNTEAVFPKQVMGYISLKILFISTVSASTYNFTSNINTLLIYTVTHWTCFHF